MTFNKEGSNTSAEKIGRSTVLQFCIPLQFLAVVVIYLGFILSSLFLPQSTIELLVSIPGIIIAMLWMLLINIPLLFDTPFLSIILILFTLGILVCFGNLAGKAIIVKKKNVYLVGILTLFIIYELAFVGSYYLSLVYRLTDVRNYSCFITTVMQLYENHFFKISIFGASLALITGPFLGKKIKSKGQKAGLTTVH